MSDAVVKGCAAIEQPNWAAREMARVNLGDQRLNRRAARLLAGDEAGTEAELPREFHRDGAGPMYRDQHRVINAAV